MSEDLTNSQIALLCDIGEYALSKASEAQQRDLKSLLTGGYVEPANGRAEAAFKPTEKGMRFLGERGAGLNEA